MRIPNLKQSIGLGVTVLMLSAGSAFAATTVDNTVDVMAGPGSNFHIVARISAGDSVSVAQQKDSWCKIVATGANGWVPCTDLNGLKSTAAVAAPTPAKGWSGYDYQTDPVNGPTVLGGLHTVTSTHGFS